MVNCMWNTRVEKHNLRGSENKMNMKIRNLIELYQWLAISTTKEDGMNGSVHDD